MGVALQPRHAQTLSTETQTLEGTYRQPLELVEEHNQIVDAIETGDVNLTLNRVEQHIDEALRRLIHAEDDDAGYV